MDKKWRSAKTYVSDRISTTFVSGRSRVGEVLRENIAQMLVADGRTAFVMLAGLLTITLACGVTFLLGLPHTSIYGHDIFVYLDGSWRVLQGQRPYVDFYSSFGPVFYLLGAVGLLIAHSRVDGLVDAVVVSAVALGLWSFALIRIRLGGLAATVSLAFLMFFWVAPFPLGEPYYLPSYAMIYNRLGYVLTAIVFIEAFATREKLEEAGFDWGGVSTGIALGLLLFLKANFFVVAAALVVAAHFANRRSLKHVAVTLGSFLFICCLMFTYLHWDIGAFWHDLRIVAGARQKRFNPSKDPIRVPLRNTTAMATLIGLAFYARCCIGDAARGTAAVLRNAGVLTACAIGADYLLALSNQQRYGFPLTVVAILLIADRLCRVPTNKDPASFSGAFAVSLVMVVSVLPFVFDTVNAWTIEPTVRASTVLSKAARVNASQMASLVFDDHVDPVWDQREVNGHILVNKVNDGLALLRANSSSTDRIACLCINNPFNYALQRTPPSGGSPAFFYGTDFTERFAPSAARILGDSNLVIYPRLEKDSPTVATLLKICDPILSKEYRPYVESEQWVMLKRIKSKP
jgi:hypothetical protein